MSRLPPPSQKKRKLEDAVRGKTSRPKKSKRQRVEDYHSSSDEGEDNDVAAAPVSLANETRSKANETPIGKPQRIQRLQSKTKQPSGNKDKRPVSPDPSSAEDSTDESDASDEGERSAGKPKQKRNDPDVFATIISKILSTKLPQSVRQDPVLSRSKTALDKSTSIANERLERKAKAKLRAEKREELDRGRVTDVLGIETGTTGEVAEEEKRLRKIAQRGVVALFNAFTAAQVKGQQAARDEQRKGTVGINRREEKVKEMSKQGFLELINGQKKAAG